MANVNIERDGKEPLTLVIDDGIKDDMELFETLCAIDEKDPIAMAKLTRQLLGEESKKALYDYLRGENGRVKIMDVMNAIKTIFNGLDDTEKK